MFQRFIDDIKTSTGSAIRQTSLVAWAALCLFITVAFLCAAAFIAVLDSYGPIVACLTGAAVFFIVALIASGIYLVRKRQLKAQAAARETATTHSLLRDPALLATGLQIVRLVGVKRLIPILAVGGLALGLLASRGQTAADQTPAE